MPPFFSRFLFPTLLSANRRSWLARHAGALLGVLWLLSQLLLLWKYGGPRLMTDSTRYLAYATDIATRGHFAHGHYLRYVGYPFYCSLWLRVGAGVWGIVIGQIAVAGLAGMAFYRTLRHLTSLPFALAGTTLALFFFDSQFLNVYILTDSLFISGITLGFWALTFAQGSWGLIRLLLLATLTTLLRPNGFLLPLALATAGLLEWWPTAGIRARRVAVFCGGVTCVIAWLGLNKLLLTFTLVETYLRGEVIYLYPAITVVPTGPLLLPPIGFAPLTRLAYFIFHNPSYFAQLALYKGTLLLTCIKPAYSWKHLVVLMTILYPAYWLAWRGYTSQAVPQRIRHFLGGFIGLQTVVVMLTIEDWDTRFLAPMLPCVFALATFGAAAILKSRTRPPRTAPGKPLTVPGPAL